MGTLSTCTFFYVEKRTFYSTRDNVLLYLSSEDASCASHDVSSVRVKETTILKSGSNLQSVPHSLATTLQFIVRLSGSYLLDIRGTIYFSTLVKRLVAGMLGAAEITTSEELLLFHKVTSLAATTPSVR